MSPKISLFLPSLEGGGAERVFVELANEFAAIGFRVDIALASAHGPYIEEITRGVRVVDFNSSGVLRSLPKLARYLASERPHVLLSGLDHANLVAIFARSVSRNGTRCVISIRSVPTVVHSEERSLSGWVELQLMKRVYRFSDAVIANSRFVTSSLSGMLRIPESKLRVIYNPLNLEAIQQLSRQAVAHPWFGADTPPVILGVGSLSLLKDFRTLVRAFSLVRSKRDCRLVILGEGPYRAKLDLLVGELGLRGDVALPGFVQNPFSWMRGAAVFVSSSLTEGCPNALMQALACGSPVVSTDCPGGSAEILDGGKWGRLVPVGDAEAMAAAIADTLDCTAHPDARQRVEDFAITRIARQYLETLLPDHAPGSLEH